MITSLSRGPLVNKQSGFGSFQMSCNIFLIQYTSKLTNSIINIIYYIKVSKCYPRMTLLAIVEGFIYLLAQPVLIDFQQCFLCFEYLTLPELPFILLTSADHSASAAVSSNNRSLINITINRN